VAKDWDLPICGHGQRILAPNWTSVAQPVAEPASSFVYRSFHEPVEWFHPPRTSCRTRWTRQHFSGQETAKFAQPRVTLGGRALPTSTGWVNSWILGSARPTYSMSFRTAFSGVSALFQRSRAAGGPKPPGVLSLHRPGRTLPPRLSLFYAL